MLLTVPVPPLLTYCEPLFMVLTVPVPPFLTFIVSPPLISDTDTEVVAPSGTLYSAAWAVR